MLCPQSPLFICMHTRTYSYVYISSDLCRQSNNPAQIHTAHPLSHTLVSKWLAKTPILHTHTHTHTHIYIHTHRLTFSMISPNRPLEIKGTSKPQHRIAWVFFRQFNWHTVTELLASEEQLVYCIACMYTMRQSLVSSMRFSDACNKQLVHAYTVYSCTCMGAWLLRTYFWRITSSAYILCA